MAGFFANQTFSVRVALAVLEKPVIIFDPEARWLSHFEGQESKNRHSRALERFETIVGVKATDLLEVARKDIVDGGPPEQLEDALTRYYNDLIEQGQAKSSAAQWYSLIRGSFSANHIRLGRTPRHMTASGSAYESSRVLTQKQVQAMIESVNKPRNKLVIAFPAQTGQRLGVMTAIKYPMIRKIDTHGLVEVPPSLLNPNGDNVNKAEIRYKFIIGEDTMRLIEKTCDKTSWILDLSERQIGRIVDKAATSVGVQERIETKLNRSWHVVHPHVFRRYWVERVTTGGMLEAQREFMMGHKLPYGGTYVFGLLTDEKLLRAYRKAEKKLEVL